jgi:uncharacterized phage protein (TIGR01671 family)
MREIKFRVWDGEFMHHFELSDISAGGAVTGSEHGCIDLFNGERKGDIMQYTGLKDKNGVEIYEGDICEDVLNEKWQGKIYFEDACFYFGWESIVEPLSEVNDQLEVIGNIYKNPRLVK